MNPCACGHLHIKTFYVHVRHFPGQEVRLVVNHNEHEPECPMTQAPRSFKDALLLIAAECSAAHDAIARLIENPTTTADHLSAAQIRGGALERIEDLTLDILETTETP